MPPSQTRIALADRFKVVDVDTHLFEPDDIWTARVSKTYGNLVPHIRRDPKTQVEYWYSGDTLLTGGMRGGTAGAVGAAPARYPRNIDETDPSAWNAKARLGRLDDHFGREFHAGGAQIHAPIGIPGEGAHPAVRVGDSRAKEQIQDAGEHGISQVAVQPRHRPRLDGAS